MINKVTDLYYHAINEYGCKTAFIVKEGMKTYSDVDQDVRVIAGWIQKEAFDNYALLFQNQYLFAVAYFAVMVCGKVAVLLNDEIRRDHKEGFLNDTEVINILKLSTETSDYEKDVVINSDQVCTVIYTSGTTAERKKVLLSHRNLAVNCLAGLEKVEYKQGKKFLNLLPYAHVFGLVCELLAAFYSGCIIQICETPLSFFQMLRVCRPDYLNLPPAVLSQMCSMITDRGKERAVGSNLKRILCGGAKISKAVVESLAAHDIIVLTCYGMSEAPGICINQEFNNNPNSVGKPVNCCEVIIADDGEILVSGENVMIGYNNWEIQPFCYINGKKYLKTGDIGKLDAKGFLYIRGRKDNVLVFQDGTKISAESYEDIVRRLDGVRECIVRYFISGSDILTVDVVASESVNTLLLESQIKQVRIKEHSIQNVRFVPFIKKTSGGKVMRYR